MSDQENFLTRWSRRKREIAEEKALPEKPAVEATVKPAAQGEEVGQGTAAHAPDAKAPPAPEFDVSKLPSIDSIVADTDISVFLQAGVPSSLRHAALRRAWVMDPAIRDYIGLAENAWDFTDPNAMPGFGALDPGTDVEKLVGEIFRDARQDVEAIAKAVNSPAPDESPARVADSSGSGSAADPPVPGKSTTEGGQQVAAASNNKDLLQRDENIATQHDDSTDEPAAEKVRRHGGALPH